MLKFYVRHGKRVAKNHEINSFKQSGWLEKYKNFITRKRNLSKNDFEKDFYELLSNSFHGKTKEDVSKRVGLEFILKNENDKIIKQKLN